MAPHYCGFCCRSFSTWWAWVIITGQYKDFKEIQTWTIVNNRFCWLLGVVAKVKKQRHSVK